MKLFKFFKGYVVNETYNNGIVRRVYYTRLTGPR